MHSGDCVKVPLTKKTSIYNHLTLKMDHRVIIASVVTISKNFLQEVMESDSDSSGSDTSDEELDMRIHMQLRGPQRKPVRIEGYIEHTIPQLHREQFRQHFRMTPTTYNQLEQRLAPILQGDVGMKSHIPVRKQLLATLWLLATPDSYRSVGERFDMSKSSLNVSFMRVVQALNDIARDVIQWPREDRLATVKQKFQRLSVLPDIIGAVDGTHISIKEPYVNSLSYKTYKKKYAVILQAICDSELVFLDCFAGYPGSVGDIRVFRNSDLWSEVQRDRQSYFPNEEYIIGDKAYPILRWCISAFRDRGNLTAAQKRFNNILSTVRQVIERAFALLKGRFRRLKYLDMNRMDMIPFVIIACTVLHNICLERFDENIEEYILEGWENENIEEGRENEVCVQDPVADEDAGLAKRNYLVTLV
ncbi:protein ANTAGONIST OF LIKE HETEROCHROMATIN PROTEIN 1-like [Nylanderia fulva]|uniref:protein ANTAGONIST OF LIKE HETEROCHROMATIN PROTEIN 1-like n=1 Tax=Nylanderia fulva TaxID=613905 RepID=UPI0010FB960C|nr:protein ANTAGONIST OF LIKE HETEROCHROMATIN PROTEIN 1-like [Nylanderia fulva]